ncbi:MAG: peptide chain release factor N(5)-glutamine methyltransferase [Candidatus Omnitrophota bacterium]
MIKTEPKNTISEAIKFGDDLLRKSNNLSSRCEVEILLAFLLNCSRLQLYLNLNQEISDSILNKFKIFLKQRLTGIPLQYIIGQTYFFGLKFQVEAGVFIPRPETEVLVLRLVSLIRQEFPGKAKILEFCTGSGNISVALTKSLQYCKITSSDINSKALELARKNAQIHGVRDKITFIQGDLFRALSPLNQTQDKFDLIVANPPYLATYDLEKAPVEVCFEPQNALDGGILGIDFYNRIISGVKAYLAKRGFIAFEFGDNQKEQIEKLIINSNFFETPEFFADLNGIFRFVIARRVNG